MVEYVTIKIRQDDYQILKKLAGEKPITQFVHELLALQSQRIDQAVELAERKLQENIEQAEELMRKFRVEVLERNIDVKEDGDILNINAKFVVKIGNPAVRKFVVRALGG